MYAHFGHFFVIVVDDVVAGNWTAMVKERCKMEISKVERKPSV